MKTIAKLLIICVVVLTTTIPALAQTNDLKLGGVVNLDEVSRNLFGHNIEYIGGGVREYGVDLLTSYSKYDHQALWHSSSVKGRNYIKVIKPAGYKVVATVPRSISGNIAWWDAWQN